MDFLDNFSSIILSSNLFIKLFEIGEKWLKNPLSFLAVHKKRLKKQFFGAEYIFSVFRKRSCSVSKTSWVS